MNFYNFYKKYSGYDPNNNIVVMSDIRLSQQIMWLKWLKLLWWGTEWFGEERIPKSNEFGYHVNLSLKDQADRMT